MIKSIYENQQEILNAIQILHCPDGFECDLTYGNGNFYKDREKPKFCFDIDPQFDYVIKADSCAVPIDSGTIHSVVIDPPFLTYVKNGRDHKNGTVAMTKRFGGYYSYQELIDHYIGTIKESNRILKKNGIMIFKCQDIIHNHSMHSTHTNVIKWAEENGFKLKDLFILCAKHRMPGPQKGVQKHARIYHSYFLVFKKKF